jgi:predicted nucleic acid-binding protein
MVDPVASRHNVPHYVADTPILRADLAAGADYLVTNDRHLHDLNPYEGLRIVSMAKYHQILVNEGVLLPPS